MESGLGRLKAEHPTIGGIEIFGNTIWLDWLMIVVMVLTRRPLRSYPAPAGRGALRQRPGG